MEIPILFEDEHLIAVNKPANLSVHSTPARPDETDLQTEMQNLLRRDLILFHRLDRDTTGVVLFGKRREIAAKVTQAFEKRLVRKAYMTVVRGRWDNGLNKVELPIEVNGEFKAAASTFRVLKANDEKSWLEVLLKTGRKHQIRPALSCKRPRRHG